MKLYEEAKKGINVYDYTLNQERVSAFKEMMLATIPEGERVYSAKTNGAFLLRQKHTCVPHSFLNSPHLGGSIGKPHYHDFIPSTRFSESLLKSYYESFEPMLGTISTSPGPREFYLKTSEYVQNGGLYQMDGIIHIPESLYHIESLLACHEGSIPSELCISYADLFDLGLPTFYDESFVENMLATGLISQEHIKAIVESSKDILMRKRTPNNQK